MTTRIQIIGSNEARPERPGARGSGLLGNPTAWSVVAGLTGMTEDDVFRDPFAEFLPSSR